jgi:hypothetical protein
MMLDLEDAVPPEAKDSARTMVAQILATGGRACPPAAPGSRFAAAMTQRSPTSPGASARCWRSSPRAHQPAVAERLAVSEHTVHRHVINLLRKLAT